MSLLEFARGPALEVGFAVFGFGVLWRLASLLLLRRAPDWTAPRPGAPSKLVAVLGGQIRHLWPAKAYRRGALLVSINSYVFHLGLVVIIFGLAQHIMLLQGLFGISWPNLPSGIVFAVAIVTLASLLAMLARRLVSPVLRLISGFDDYASWLFTILPVATGIVATNHLWARYETLLGVHILSVAALLIWLPFGKLMHGALLLITRGRTAAFYARRGAAS